MVIQLISLNEVWPKVSIFQKILRPDESTLSLKLFKLNPEVQNVFVWILFVRISRIREHRDWRQSPDSGGSATDWQSSLRILGRSSRGNDWDQGVDNGFSCIGLSVTFMDWPCIVDTTHAESPSRFRD